MGPEPQAMNWAVLACAAGVLGAVWGCVFVAWRWTRRRLGLLGPDLPEMSQRERSVRRSLRSLLAFDFFVMWPLGVPSCAAAVIVAFDHRDMIGPAVGAVLGLALFTVAVPSLARTARELERQRLSCGPDLVPASVWIDGTPPTAGSSLPARWGWYAVVGVGTLVAILDWEFFLAAMFYGVVATAVALGWNALRRRRAQRAPMTKPK